jgi:hypothetical protein
MEKESKRIIRHKCSSCFYEAFNKENVEKHIQKTRKCKEATIIEIEIKCEFCDRSLPTEAAKSNHEKICKNKRLDDLLDGQSIEEQNKILIREYSEQNKYIEQIERQLRLFKYKFAREEEVNNMALESENGLSANELHNYCVFTLRRLFENLILPAMITNSDIKRIEIEKAKIKAKEKLKQDVKQVQAVQTVEEEED